MSTTCLNSVTEDEQRLKCEIYSTFQPIVSITKRKIVGYEGLARGFNHVNHSVVLPDVIFSNSIEIDEKVSLDRLCRDACLKAFKTIFQKNKEVFIFVNLDASILEYVGGSSYLYQQALKYGIDPKNIVIEIKESMIKEADRFVQFVEDYKARGFLIALDDIGSGFSNFERIAIVKPDILKFDRSLVEGIDNNYILSETFQCLVRLANRIGALVVAEGIETSEEAIKCMEYGAHFLQGYYFAKPQIFDESIISGTEQIIDKVCTAFKGYMKDKIETDKKRKHNLEQEISRLIQYLENSTNQNTDEHIGERIKQFLQKTYDLDLECAYILDTNGIQKTETYFWKYLCDERKKMMFLPAEKGTDNSLKKYYYELVNSEQTTYTSGTYISSATGSTCVTISRLYKDKNGNLKILCIDKRFK